MAWLIANIKNPGVKKCAFCRNWYDPTNKAIRPKSPIAGLWEFDPNARNKCLISANERLSSFSCSKFSLKLNNTN